MRVATGRSLQATKQVGEYRVAAELARQDFLVATFSGSIPYYDLVACDESGRCVFVQVKANTGGSWQLDIRTFANVTLKGQRQTCHGARPEPYPGIVYVFIRVAKTGDDKFFIVDWKALSDMLTMKYGDYLAKHDGVRPKNPKSFHMALKVCDLEPFRNRWIIIKPLPNKRLVKVAKVTDFRD